MDQSKRIACIVTAVIASAAAGFVGGRSTAAVDPLQIAPDSKSGIGIYASSGETPDALRQAAGLNIEAFEPEDKEGGGGALQKTLIDNDALKVNIVSFKKGFERPGGMKRRYNTLLVYIDSGRYTIMKRGANSPIANPVPDKLAPGSAVFHRKGSIVSETRIDEDYRVLFIEMK